MSLESGTNLENSRGGPRDAFRGTRSIAATGTPTTDRIFPPRVLVISKKKKEEEKKRDNMERGSSTMSIEIRWQAK